MVRKTNPAGNVKYDNEDELKEQLEKLFFPRFFDNNWEPKLDITKEVWISNIDRIDYYGKIKEKGTFVEVKNWFTTKKDLKQILGYKKQLMFSGADLYLICGGIEEYRRKILEKNNIEIILVKDIKELDPEAVVYWM
jgi:hypothetical protein